MSTQNLKEKVLHSITDEALVNEQAQMRQANRLLARGGKSVTKKKLMTIEAEDILGSRVFKESIPDFVVA